VSNAATLPISARGSCVAAPYWPLSLPDASSTGLVVLSRQAVSLLSANGSYIDSTTEYGSAVFVRASVDTPPVTPAHLLPPPGHCVSGTGLFQAGMLRSGFWADAIVRGVLGKGLDAGRYLRARRPGVERQLSPDPGQTGVYSGRLGGSLSQSQTWPLFLDPGEVTVGAPGGSGAGPFEVRLAVPRDFAWVNRERIASIDRSRGLDLQWKDPEPNRWMAILAAGIDGDSTAMALTLCLAPSAAGHFRIEPDYLANFPATAPAPGQVPSGVALAALRNRAPAEFRAAQIARGRALITPVKVRAANFR
jgi:hypothetical protein